MKNAMTSSNDSMRDIFRFIEETMTTRTQNPNFDEWEAWMEERENRRQYREDEPETIVEEPQPQRRKAEPLWRDRDLV